MAAAGARGAILCRPAYQCQRANCDGYRWQHIADAKGEPLICTWCQTPFPKRPQMRPVPPRQARATAVGARRDVSNVKGDGKGKGKDKNNQDKGKGKDRNPNQNQANKGKGAAAAPPQARTGPRRAPWWRGEEAPATTEGDVDYDNPTAAQLADPIFQCTATMKFARKMGNPNLEAQYAAIKEFEEQKLEAAKPPQERVRALDQRIQKLQEEKNHLEVQQSDLSDELHALLERQESLEEQIHGYETQLKTLYLERDDVAAALPAEPVPVDSAHVDFGTFVTKGVQMVKEAGKDQAPRLLELLYDQLQTAIHQLPDRGPGTAAPAAQVQPAAVRPPVQQQALHVQAVPSPAALPVPHPAGMDEQAAVDQDGFQKVRRTHRRTATAKAGPFPPAPRSSTPPRGGTPAQPAAAHVGDILNAPDHDLDDQKELTPVAEHADDARQGQLQEILPQVDGALRPGDGNQNQRGGGNLT